MNSARIYFDHNATTPLAPQVLAAMSEAGELYFANPSSLHAEGRLARQAVEQARGEVAALLGAEPSEIVFTSGGTEGNNLAVLGIARAARQRGGPAHIISSPLEHPSVGAALSLLDREGFTVTRLPVDAQGRIAPAALRQALAAQPAALVSLALCNHELGNLYPMAEFAEIAHAHGAWLHCDAVQAAGRVPIDVQALGVDLLTLSAHKIQGPKGVGALYCREQRPRPEKTAAPAPSRTASGRPRAGDVMLAPPLPLPPPPLPLILGGQQEKGRRAGTENVLGIIGLGRACRFARERLLPAAAGVAELRNRLEDRLLRIPGARRHGDPTERAPGTANLAFAGVEAELLFMNLDLRGAAVSTGAACSSGSPEPSPVLLALGLPRRAALEAVRFSLGATNTQSEVDRVAGWVEEIVGHIRGLGS